MGTFLKLKMRNIFLIIVLVTSLLPFDSQSQKKKSNQKEGKKNLFNVIKEKSSKDAYKYNQYFYAGIKERSLENFDLALEYFEKCIKINNLEAAPYYEIARIYFHAGQYDKSLPYSKRSVELESQNKWYLELYAENLFNNLDFSGAIKIFTKLIKEYKGNEDYYVSLARVHIYAENLKLAIKTYNNLEKIKGVNHFTSLQKYQLYMDMQSFDLAANEVERLIKVFPEDGDLYEILADCYILNNENEKAFDILKSLTLIDSSAAGAHLALSDFYLKKGDREMQLKELSLAFLSEKLDARSKIVKFLPILQSISMDTSSSFKSYNLKDVLRLSKILVNIHPQEQMTHYIYADLLRQDRNFEKSIIHYKKALDINGNHQDAWIDMLFLQFERKEYQEVILYSKKALDFFPTNPTIYYLNGLAYYSLKEYQSSINSIKIGINFVAKNKILSSEMYSLLGEGYNHLKDYENSDKAFDNALQLSPNNTLILNNYAYYLCLREERLEEAEKMSKRTLEIASEEASYYDTYAWILYKMKMYSKAKSFMIIAIEKGGDSNFVIMEHMSEILYQLGEKEESETYKNKSLELKNNDTKKVE